MEARMKLLKGPKQGPKVLVYDIETAPILGYVWQLWDQNVGLNQIKTDWYVLSWGAKWLNSNPKSIMYMDQRNVKNIENDKNILEHIWRLLDEADIVITQNGKQFDQKKLNARFILNGMQPPSSYKHIDTLQIAKRHFGFSSNKLEYMADKINKKYKKLKHETFSGFELWKECLAGNIKAWKEMERYNKHDVLSLEELYTKLIPWDNTINFNLYRDDLINICKCGNDKFESKGYAYTAAGRYKRFRCTKCGAEIKNRKNEFSKDKKDSLKPGTIR
jgi:hypothetical protein